MTIATATARLFNPATYDGSELDPETQRVLRATIDWFEADGNKRLAWAAARVFCLLNGHDLTFSVDEAETMVVAVASGELDVPDLAKAIELDVPTA